MKKVFSVCVALLLALSILVGCVPGNTQPTATEALLSEKDAKIVDKLRTLLKDSDSLFEDISDLVADQMASADKFALKLTDAKEAGEIVDASRYISEVEEGRETISEYLSQIDDLRESVDKLKSPDAEQIETCVEGVREFFAMAESCLQDLDQVLLFFLDEEKAMAPYNELVADEDEDFLVQIENVYNAIDESITNLNDISSCPTYMQESFSIYIKKFSIYQNMLETMYMGVSLSDPLRITSSVQLYDRQMIEETKYSLQIFDLINLQIDKVDERLKGPVLLLNSELATALGAVKKADDELPDVEFTYLAAEPQVTLDYDIVDTIFPNLYNSMDSVVNLTATVDYGSINAIVTAEIPGLTQVYEEKITITNQVTKLLIKPPLLTSGLDLSSSRDTQIVFSVEDQDTGKLLAQESQKLNLMSIYDFALTDDEFGVTSRDNVLSWLTPESEGILTLRRDAVTWVDTYTSGEVNSLIGYQDYGLFEDVTLNTYIQIMAIQGAISDSGVRYNMGAYSLSDDTNQRVLLPDDVLSSKSGICIETAILVATAIQSAGMHAMILFIPGHAQVAVETWAGSGEYFLVETTLLPYTGTDEENNSLITYLSADEWANYVDDPWGDGSGSAYIVDCDLVIPLGLQGIS